MASRMCFHLVCVQNHLNDSQRLREYLFCRIVTLSESEGSSSLQLPGCTALLPVLPVRRTGLRVFTSEPPFSWEGKRADGSHPPLSSWFSISRRSWRSGAVARPHKHNVHRFVGRVRLCVFSLPQMTLRSLARS